jgi:hypothetical protein
MMDTLSLVSRFSWFLEDAYKNSTRISSDRHIAFVGVVLAAHMQKAIDRCEDAERDRVFEFDSSPWTELVFKNKRTGAKGDAKGSLGVVCEPSQKAISATLSVVSLPPHHFVMLG